MQGDTGSNSLDMDRKASVICSGVASTEAIGVACLRLPSSTFSTNCFTFLLRTSESSYNEKLEVTLQYAWSSSALSFGVAGYYTLEETTILVKVCLDCTNRLIVRALILHSEQPRNFVHGLECRFYLSLP